MRRFKYSTQALERLRNAIKQAYPVSPPPAAGYECPTNQVTVFYIDDNGNCNNHVIDPGYLCSCVEGSGADGFDIAPGLANPPDINDCINCTQYPELCENHSYETFVWWMLNINIITPYNTLVNGTNQANGGNYLSQECAGCTLPSDYFTSQPLGGGFSVNGPNQGIATVQTPQSCTLSGCLNLFADNYMCDLFPEVCMDAGLNMLVPNPFYFEYPYVDTGCEIGGCTDETANNYEDWATTDNGSCDYDLDNDGILDADEVEGCTDSEAFNYNPTATDDDGSCIDTVIGCTDPTAFNYNELANTDDGTCYPIVFGCTNELAFNYNPEANTNDGSCIATIPGCTDNTACNYNLEANTDDGSCNFETGPFCGCTTIGFDNYNGSATIDNGTCTYTGCLDNSQYEDGTFIYLNAVCNSILAGTISPISGFSLCLSADTDGDDIPDGLVPNQSAGTFIDASEQCSETDIEGCTDPAAENFDPNANLDDGNCDYIEGCLDPVADNYLSTATLNIQLICNYVECLDPTAENYICDGDTSYLCLDTDNDGINDTLNPLMGSFEDSGLCEYMIEGCTIPEANNFMSNATINDGSCEIPGCSDTNACNPSIYMYESGTIIDDGSCEYESCAGCTDETACNYDLTATIDNESCEYPPEGYDCEGNIGGCYTIKAVQCTPNIQDLAPQITNQNPPGGFEKTFECVTIDNFHPELGMDFTAPGYSIDLSNITGCTDQGACNYNENAVIDSGCEYISCAGCTDNNYVEFDPTATIDDGSCVTEVIYGCTDPSFDNYNQFANTDDGSCASYVYGCTDPSAENYNPSADADDGSCQYEGLGGPCELCPPGEPWGVNNNPPYPNVPWPANLQEPGPQTGGYYCPVSLQPECCQYYRFDNPGDGNSYYHPNVVEYIDYCNNWYGVDVNPPNNIAFG